MIHRCWKVRFRSEVSSIRYLRNGEFCGTTLLDIGANKGVYSIYMSRAAGANGGVIAFEAQPEMEAHLRAVKRSFRLDNLRIVSVGLSSSIGTRRMHRPHVGAGAASFHLSGRPVARDMEELEVRVTTLDAFLGGADEPISFIKCDVEGHEYDVFLGAERTLKKHMPTIFVPQGSQPA